MITKEILEKWLEALRSGRYKQGKGRLRHDDEFCCMGVLCDVIDPNAWILDKFIAGLYSWNGEEHYPSKEYDTGYNITLSHLNDLHNFSFMQIISWIEEHIKPEE